MKYIKLRPCIPINFKIPITLHRLDSGDTLHTLADLYGISRPSASIIVRKTYEWIKKLLGPFDFERSTLGKMKKIVAKFESLHEISYILGAMNGTHILIFVPSIDLTSI